MRHLHPVGFPNGLAVHNSLDLYTQLPAILDKLRQADPDNLRNVYYSVAHMMNIGGPEPSRTALDFEYQTTITFDFDYIDTARVWEYLPIAAEVLKVAPSSLIFTCTGNGAHVTTHLKTPIRSAKYMKELKPAYNELCHQMNRRMQKAELPGSLDPSIFEPARILRLPNTMNEKKGVKRECLLLQCPNPHIVHDLDLMKLSGLDKAALENISAEQLKKNYPRPDFREVAKECGFVRWAIEKPEEVHEEQFFGLISLLGAMSPGDKIEHAGTDKGAKEVAEAVFTGAVNSKSLQGSDFGKKWEDGMRYGARKCSTVSQTWLGGCEKCPHYHKIPTPLALKSDAHVSSEENGYWVFGLKGPLHPHYSDLSKVYRRENAYVACEPDRVFTFNGTQYHETGQLTVKAWIEKRVGYEESLRDMHCVEFVKKVLRTGAITVKEEQDLFEHSTRGKLNCKNGVIDITTGLLIPHASTLGFKYTLPYDYIENEVSEEFLNWLSEIMQDRIELMDALLDVMAYCLWPNYDDALFTYFVGDGANGKSTLIHIIQALVGQGNYAAISLPQLGGNRFAPANLEGKLVNLSEESSGTEMSFEEMNAIKNLSAGGDIEAERKGQQAFTFNNKAKLIFSANKTPRFKEAGPAIRRRMLVIPFDHKITNPDKRVENRLIADIPKICSMLVRRIQENVLTNGGRFVVSRGGASAQEAQEKVLMAGNSVVEWAKECLESDAGLSEDKYISGNEAFQKYTQWCLTNNFKATNSAQFGYLLTHGVLSSAVKSSKVLRIGGKSVRVYPRTQWKEDV